MTNTNRSTCLNQLIIFTTYCPSSFWLLFKVVKTSRSACMFKHVKKVEAASSLKNIVGIKSCNMSTVVSNDWMLCWQVRLINGRVSPCHSRLYLSWTWRINVDFEWVNLASKLDNIETESSAGVEQSVKVAQTLCKLISGCGFTV